MSAISLQWESGEGLLITICNMIALLPLCHHGGSDSVCAYLDASEGGLGTSLGSLLQG